VHFLADEGCDFQVVEVLRVAGHDVEAVAQVTPGAPDLDVIEFARLGKRILLTEDRDFGQLVFAARAAEGAGVLYVRCPEAARITMPKQIVALVGRLGAELDRSFVVWTPRRVRVRPFGPT